MTVTIEAGGGWYRVDGLLFSTLDEALEYVRRKFTREFGDYIEA
jgi:hypothetical protein